MINERLPIIKEILDEKGGVTLKELEKIFTNVSSMTLRRDLELLEKQEIVVRVKGGAKSIKHLFSSAEPLYSERETENKEGKMRIAQMALSYIESRRSFYFDSGSTVMELAKKMNDVNVYITTSGLNIANELIKKSLPTINIVGGTINRHNLSISGDKISDLLKRINIDIAFMTPSGYSLDDGFTCGNANECELKKLIIEKARKVIVLMDKSKLDKCMPYTFTNLENVDIVICDEKPPIEMIKMCEEKNVTVLY